MNCSTFKRAIQPYLSLITLKLAAVIVVLLAMAAAWRWTPLGQWLDLDRLVSWGALLQNDVMRALIAIAVYVAGSFIMAPVMLLVGATGLVFPPVWAPLVALGGCLSSAAVSYAIGSRLGRNTIRRLGGKRLHRLNHRLAQRGILASAVIHSLPVAPFTMVNLLAGAARIKFSDFIIGTGLGINCTESAKGGTMNSEKPEPGAQSSFNWRWILWGILIWMLLSSLLRGLLPVNSAQSISYTEFKKRVDQGLVTEITMKGDEISGTAIRKPESAAADDPGYAAGGQKGDRTYAFSTVKPAVRDPGFLPQLEKHGVTVNAVSEGRPWVLTLIIGMLPWLLIIGLIAYSSKKMRERMGGGMGSVFGFAKSKAKRYKATATGKTFDDVAGLDNAKRELREIVAYLKDPSKFRALGGELPKGLLLVGPPGVGKTLLAQAAAGEADVPFFSISGSEFIEMFVGVGASRVRDMFAQAKKSAPTIIFVDELDSIGRVRGTGLGGGHDEREQTLNQILAEMDGFSPHESLVMLAATNRPDVLDPALVRPGRFDRRIILDLPQKDARKKILETHTRGKPLAEDVDLESIAERTVGLSGADLKNLVNEAALLAAREDKQKIEMRDFGRARDKVLIGLEREDRITETEKKTIAYHEAGHAMMAALLPEADPLQKVSIIPRGQSLGATEQMPVEDRHHLRRGYLLDRIAIILGGRSAEKIVFEDVSTGAGDDLKKATQLARRMVSHWGMSDALGPVAYRDGEPHPFLGRELSERRDYSERTAWMIDEEVQRIVRDMEKRALDTLSSHRSGLDAVAQGLLERETLNKEDVDRILGDIDADQGSKRSDVTGS